MTQDTIDKLLTIPSFKARYDLKFANGHEQGMATGIATGRAEGVAQGKIEVLLDLFSMNHDKPSQAARTVIDACSDPGQAAEWIRSAHLGKTSKEIFGC